MLGHELRNPLGAVSNACSAARGRRRRGGARMLDVIERQGGTSTASAATCSKCRASPRRDLAAQEALDLRAVLVRAVETAQPWIDERRHRLALERPPQAMTLAGDSMRLEQVFANLLHNAAKYTDPGGRIEVVVERAGDTAVVRVRDDGIGSQADLLPHVFELFTQGDRSLDRARGGLGIGLTLVRRIVELHGGTIEARSEGAGRGTEMVVCLPVGEAVPAAEEAATGAPPPDERRDDQPLMLIVEDQVDAADGLAELMRMQGYAVEIALDGTAALTSAAARTPAVVLLDLGLPGIDGYEVARRMRQLPGLGQALLIALSGYGGEEDRRRGRDAGIDHHLVKPVELRVLEQVLARLRRPAG